MDDNELLRKLGKMTIPIQRRHNLTKSNLKWLSKNLYKVNSENKHFPSVIEEVNKRLENGEYAS